MTEVLFEVRKSDATLVAAPIDVTPVTYGNYNGQFIVNGEPIRLPSGSCQVSTDYAVNLIPQIYCVTARNRLFEPYYVNVPETSGSTVSASAIMVNPPSPLPLGNWNAISASYAFFSETSSSLAQTASLAYSASIAASALTAGSAVSSSYAVNSSNAVNSLSASFVSASNISGVVTSASFAKASISSSNALTSSFALVASGLNFTPLSSVSASYAGTASVLLGAIVSSSYSNSASFSQNSFASISASYAATATWANNVISASVASSASFATVANSVNGTVPNATSSSFATNSLTASAINFTPATASFAATASYVNTANSVSSSFAQSASLAQASATSTTASYALNSGFALNSNAAQSATNATFAVTASYIAAGNVSGTIPTASYALTSSKSLNATSASMANSASTSTTAVSSSYAVTASFALVSSFQASTASFAGTASLALFAISASTSTNALTASFITGSKVSGVVTSASYSLVNLSSSYSTNAGTAQLALDAQIANLANTSSYAFTAVNAQSAKTASLLTDGVGNTVWPAFGQLNILGENGDSIIIIPNNIAITLANGDFIQLTAGEIDIGSNQVNIGGETVSMQNSFVDISGGGILNCPNATGSLFGTASWSNNSLTASFALNGGSTLTTGSSYPITSSWALNAISASFAITSSKAITSSFLSGKQATLNSDSGQITSDGSGNLTVNTIIAPNGISTTFIQDSVGDSLSLVNRSAKIFDAAGDNFQLSNGAIQLASVSGSSISMSNVVKIAGQISASVITASLFFGTASYAGTASFLLGLITSASFAASASYALSASYFGNGTNGYFPLWSSNKLTATSSIQQSGSAVVVSGTSKVVYDSVIYDFTVTDGALMILENPDASAQSKVMFTSNGSPLGGMRTDFQGNFSYYAAGPQGIQFIPSLSIVSGSMMNVTTTGLGVNLGVISSTSPQYTIDVNGATGNANTISYFFTDGTTQDVNGATVSYIGANGGNVGIGTSSPLFTLDVTGDVNFTGNLNKNGTPLMQAGSASVSSTTSKIITFATAFANKNYAATVTPESASAFFAASGKTVNGFTASCNTTYTGLIDWTAVQATQ